MSVDVSDLLPVVEPEIESNIVLVNSSSRRERYKHGITMAVLFLINLLNYMDRFSIAGALIQIQSYFNVGDTEGGLLQTVFVCSYMLFAPLFGYLGDRYSRKFLIIIGVSFWSLTTLSGSFIPKDYFIIFIILRGLVGVGEASYSCVAPTIIADMYRDNMRTLMLAVFNIAVPLGSGLGYILGAYVTKVFNGDWRWALRITPALGAICILLLIILVHEPVRGGADGAKGLKQNSWFRDVRKIFKVKSFILTTVGFTWVAFALGSLSWWGPKFIQYAHAVHDKKQDESTETNDSLIFGVVACIGGLIGVIAGSDIARRIRKRTARGDPIVCGVAILLSVPFLVVAILFSKYNLYLTWVCVFFTETLLCTNWALISDMLMYIIVPARRSTASSIQIFILHLLGDASSPAIVGKISDEFLKESKDIFIKWQSLRNALLLTPVMAAIGGVGFLLAALFIVRDRREANAEIEATNMTESFRMNPPKHH